MNLELNAKNILFRADIPKYKKEDFIYTIPAYEEILDKIKTYISMESEGYNIYLIDNYSKYKTENIMDTIRNSLVGKKLKDICYVTTENDKEPEPIILSKGNGLELKASLEEIQNGYSELAVNFYNCSLKQKDEIIKDMQKKRNEMLALLLETAKEEGFDVKPTSGGFSFVPLKEGEPMLEKDYDELNLNMKDDVLFKLTHLKEKARDILETIKNDETETLHKIKEVMLKYIVEEISTLKAKFYSYFTEEKRALDYLKYVCESIEKDLVETYTSNFEEDEEKINEVIYQYDMNVIVDNSEKENPNVVFEEDPTLNNLMGTIEYENHSGNYLTDVSLIKAGSLLNANGGCIILRAAALFSNPASYHFLKKTLMNGKMKFDHTRSYLDLLTMNSLKPKPIDLKVKVLLIGDYETYELLYNMDEDFKYIFKVRLEYDPVIESNNQNNGIVANNLRVLAQSYSSLALESSALKEILRYLSRKAESKKKYMYDDMEIEKILIAVDNNARRKGKKVIKAEEVIESLYEKDMIEKHILDSYKEDRILLHVEDKIIGSVNGLSVIDMGYVSFGRPFRITCTCYKGEGHIVDVQKESNLSGNVHNKSVSILKGIISRILGEYSSIPVDFHISFEQIYGKVEGDSASVAEITAIISAISKIPVNQGIAVTGSINQFGEVQPVGGINEKIEGFYNICKLKGEIKGKGVLLPMANIDSIVLKAEVEEAVTKGDFHIYVMTSLEDALSVLMGDNKYTAEGILEAAVLEMKKYNTKN
ncbi:MAG: AAA family ATPase [Bacillota bacterium]|nr:AAA family ATPase [Bacillota bacterium]